MGPFGHPFPKIDSLWKREPDKKNTIIPGDFASPEFEALWYAPWDWTEKIDGTNIRYYWNGNGKLVIGGRTDNANIPAPLYNALSTLIDPVHMNEYFGDKHVMIYGEGYGPGIQPNGIGYRSKPGFIVFDVRIGDVWLRRPSVRDIAAEFGLDVVHSYGQMSLESAWAGMMMREWESTFPDHDLEGLVGRPVSMLYKNKGTGFTPILCKMKYRDITEYDNYVSAH